MFALSAGRCSGTHCPVAADLVPVPKQFSALVSINEFEVRVLREQDEARKNTDGQAALSALTGLTLPTSVCPFLIRMRPLANAHLPF
jgi:hypothetical protein